MDTLPARGAVGYRIPRASSSLAMALSDVTQPDIQSPMAIARQRR